MHRRLEAELLPLDTEIEKTLKHLKEVKEQLIDLNKGREQWRIFRDQL